MTHTTSYTIDEAKQSLLTLDTVRERLAATEPLASYGFPVGDNVRFRISEEWSHEAETLQGSDLAPASILVGPEGGRQEFQLTKDALLEATSIVGLNKKYAERTPNNFIEDQLNYWFRNGLGDKSYKVLSAGDRNTAVAVTREAINPFSNLRLLDQALDGIEDKYGSRNVLADYKFHHDLTRTHIRLIVPEYMRVIENTGTDNDTWSVGIQLKNSLIGAEQTEVSGYLFRYWCTNGSIDTFADSGTWSRRGANGRNDEVYEWARSVVDDVLGGLESSLDRVQDMTSISLEGSAASTLKDVFDAYKVPDAQRNAITSTMVDEDNMTMYALMNAVTQAANNSDLDPRHVDQLMYAGGDLIKKAHDRCDSCHRINH